MTAEMSGVVQQEKTVDDSGSAEMASDMAEVWKTPKTSGREQSQWVIAHVLEDLVGEQAQL